MGSRGFPLVSHVCKRFSLWSERDFLENSLRALKLLLVILNDILNIRTELPSYSKRLPSDFFKPPKDSTGFPQDVKDVLPVPLTCSFIRC